ncbi:MAG: hypothetical protein ACRDKB_12270 [Actinomycetota bacterium]
MSVVAPAAKRLWVPVMAGVVALAAVTAAALVVTSEPAEAPTRSASAPGGPVAAAHAEWSIRTYPTGVATKRTKADRARVAAARPRVKTLIKDLYDAVFVHPDRLRDALSQHAIVAVAREIKRSGIGLPTKAEEALIKKRSARVGIEGNRTRYAVAVVRIVSKGIIEGRRFRLVHNANLWLQREKGWKVIGFDFDQRRPR